MRGQHRPAPRYRLITAAAAGGVMVMLWVGAQVGPAGQDMVTVTAAEIGRSAPLPPSRIALITAGVRGGDVIAQALTAEEHHG